MPTSSPLVGEHGGQAGEVVADGARDEVVELVGALGRVGPGPVQVAALAHHLEERLAVGEHEVAQLDPAARAAWRAARGMASARGRAPQQAASHAASRRSVHGHHETAPGARPRAGRARARDHAARERPARLRDRRARRRAARAGRRRALGARADGAAARAAAGRATSCCGRRRRSRTAPGTRGSRPCSRCARARARRAAVPGEPGAGRLPAHGRRAPRRGAAAPSRLVLARLRRLAAAAAAADRAPRAPRDHRRRRSRARELAELLGLAPERVSVVPGGVDAAFSPGRRRRAARGPRSASRARTCSASRRTPRARTSPRSCRPPARWRGDGVDVVVAGGHRPQFAAEAGLDALRLLGHVPDALLPGLYAGRGGVRAAVALRGLRAAGARGDGGRHARRGRRHRGAARDLRRRGAARRRRTARRCATRCSRCSADAAERERLRAAGPGARRAFHAGTPRRAASTPSSPMNATRGDDAVRARRTLIRAGGEVLGERLRLAVELRRRAAGSRAARRARSPSAQRLADELARPSRLHGALRDDRRRGAAAPASIGPEETGVSRPAGAGALVVARRSRRPRRRREQPTASRRISGSGARRRAFAQP